MSTPSVADNDLRDPQNVVPFVPETHKEPEPEMLTYLCMPLVLGGVVFHIYPLFYVCLFIIISSWVSAKYGEFNFQQYSSIFMMCMMGFVMPFLQPAPHPGAKKGLSTSSPSSSPPHAAAGGGGISVVNSSSASS
ncbi:family upf0139 protein [Cystoisospora suis]|uniref:Family upf0139 protein n=1 Tax=Cystoisospora suis TaxID=483139 RepID=A0A2C6L0T8_9APIC|nr:family upf0139 protein [Cystoisospora suis]